MKRETTAIYRQFAALEAEGEIKKLERKLGFVFDRAKLKAEQKKVAWAVARWDQVRKNARDEYSTRIRAPLKAAGRSVARTNLEQLRAELAHEVSLNVSASAFIRLTSDLHSFQVSPSSAESVIWLALAYAITGRSEHHDCVQCNKAFTPERATAQFCSGRCKVRTFRQENPPAKRRKAKR